MVSNNNVSTKDVPVPMKRQVLICEGKNCLESKSDEIHRNFEVEVIRAGIQENLDVSLTSCQGLCDHGPLVFIKPEGTLYCKVKPENVKEIVKSHFVQEKPVKELFYEDPKSGERIEKYTDIEFFKKQETILNILADSVPQKIAEVITSLNGIIASENVCIVDLTANYLLSFILNESCGKCVPCRDGSLVALGLLEKIRNGEAKLEDLKDLEEISLTMKDASLCEVGQNGAIPVLYVLKHFKVDFEEHIKTLSCRTNVCTKLYTFIIDQDLCVKCGICKRVCPAGAVIGSRENGFKINCDRCTYCQMCFRKCPKGAIYKSRGKC
ncbi:MAG: NADH-ubiquinone oxidoreductase-F iron-sulfur binding region domain-containing protein [Candidatus Heimdallarchaeaceae archaeon]